MFLFGQASTLVVRISMSALVQQGIMVHVISTATTGTIGARILGVEIIRGTIINNYNNRGWGNYRRVNREPTLSVVQEKLVKETAAALARQLADLPKPPADVVAQVEQPAARSPVVAWQEEIGLSSAAIPKSSEAVMMAVAGFGSSAKAATAPMETDEGASVEGLMHGKGLKKKGPKCFRCDNPGHCLNDCVAILCDCCQKADHITRDCPLILAPKPSMIAHGVAHEELMFWELPSSGAFKPRLENTRMGRVTISNGVMTIP
jgi:hypothetical protein